MKLAGPCVLTFSDYPRYAVGNVGDVGADAVYDRASEIRRPPPKKEPPQEVAAEAAVYDVASAVKHPPRKPTAEKEPMYVRAGAGALRCCPRFASPQLLLPANVLVPNHSVKPLPSIVLPVARSILARSPVAPMMIILGLLWRPPLLSIPYVKFA